MGNFLFGAVYTVFYCLIVDYTICIKRVRLMQFFLEKSDSEVVHKISYKPKNKLVSMSILSYESFQPNSIYIVCRKGHLSFNTTPN